MSALEEHDPGPLARFEEVKADAAVPMMVFGRVCDGETLRGIAKEWRVPRGRFIEWFTAEHAALYDSALKIRADELAHEALSRADGAATPEEVPAARLQVDTRLKLAAKWDRRRYGEEAERVSITPVTIQIGGFRQWGGAIVAGETVIAEPATALPPLVEVAEDI